MTEVVSHPFPPFFAGRFALRSLGLMIRRFEIHSGSINIAGWNMDPD